MKSGKWQKVKPFTIHNTRADYDKTLSAITELEPAAEKVAIAMDHTGGYYSAPLVHFLSAHGYILQFIEGKALKDFKTRFLDKENKTDSVDSLGMAYALYARDTLNLKLRISTIKPDLDSKQAVIRVLLNIRWQMGKTITQLTNRLHQVLIATFPEGEKKYFSQLAEIAIKYPSPTDIIDKSKGLKEYKFISRTRANIIELAKETSGVPAGHYAGIVKAP